MILPLHFSLAAFDHRPTIEVAHASQEWVDASLRRHPMTRHLVIRVREEDRTVILEGRVPTRMDRQWAGSVAQHALGQGQIDNRLLVLDDLDGPLWATLPKPQVSAAMAA